MRGPSPEERDALVEALLLKLREFQAAGGPSTWQSYLLATAADMIERSERDSWAFQFAVNANLLTGNPEPANWQFEGDIPAGWIEAMLLRLQRSTRIS